MCTNLKELLYFGIVAILFYQPLFYEQSSKAATKIQVKGKERVAPGHIALPAPSSSLFIPVTPVKQIHEDKIIFLLRSHVKCEWQYPEDSAF
jgi:hypothetical protein